LAPVTSNTLRVTENGGKKIAPLSAFASSKLFREFMPDQLGGFTSIASSRSGISSAAAALLLILLCLQLVY
jgi:hypothetical protein